MTGAELNIEIEDQGGIKLVHVAGPLDSMTYEQFKSQIDPLVNQPRTRLVLDCEKLSYVNSRGLTLLARYHRLSAANLSFFGVAGLHSRILKAMDLLGMSNLIPRYESLAKALEAAQAF